MFSEFSLFLLYHVVWVCVVVGGRMVVSSDYLVSTQLQLWLFCFWGCGCCWPVTILCLRAQNMNLEDQLCTSSPQPGLKIAGQYILIYSHHSRGREGRIEEKCPKRKEKIILCPFYHILWLLQLNSWCISWPFPVTLSSQSIIMNTICKTRINLIFPFERK